MQISAYEKEILHFEQLFIVALGIQIYIIRIL